MVKITETDISELKQDDRNLNLHTERGSQAIKNSIETFGIGRSVLIDKNNKLIAGNDTTKQAENAGKRKVIIVDADADTLVAVRRNDLDLDVDPKARGLAAADNFTAAMNLEVDFAEAELQKKEFEVDIEQWGIIDNYLGNTGKVDVVNSGDENSEWVGMPEFDVPEPGCKIVINFDYEEDRQSFADKLELEFNSKTKSAWSTTYPYKENIGSQGLKYESKE